MNPPWSQCSPWIDRFIAHRNGVCLVPTSKSRWFHSLWAQSDAVVLHPRATFIFQGNNEVSTAFQAVLAAFGDECVEAIGRLGVVRRIA